MPQLSANWPDKLQRVWHKPSLIKLETLIYGRQTASKVIVQQKRLSEKALSISVVAQRCDSPIHFEKNGSDSKKLLAKDFTKIYFDRYQQIPVMVPDLFNVMSSDAAYEKTSAVGTVPDFTEFTGRVSEVSPTQEYDKTYVFTEYAAKIEIQRKLAADDLSYLYWSSLN